MFILSSIERIPCNGNSMGILHHQKFVTVQYSSIGTLTPSINSIYYHIMSYFIIIKSSSEDCDDKFPTGKNITTTNKPT